MILTETNRPNWKTISIQPHYSGRIKELDRLSKNIWWSWNHEAIKLFKYITEEDVLSDCIDPVNLLKSVSYKRFAALENDSVFISMYDRVLECFKKYIEQPYDATLPTIAYFSMEYGLTNILKIYSGGLGILAGDYLKQAGDSGYNMIGLGLFYREGYFKQMISMQGDQDEVYETQRFMDTPAELVRDEKEEAITCFVEMEGRKVYFQIWEIIVGRIKLFLLDTDRNDNTEDDRGITRRLYGGDNETRLKQELILGVGGVKAIKKMNIQKDVYHLNEGHAAFAGIERLIRLVKENGLLFNEAIEVVRSSTLFTTHTPVPAGHDAFEEDLLMRYMGDYPKKMGISWEQFMNLGKENIEAENQKFSMSFLAANTSLEINGVSLLHGEVSRNIIFNNFWKDYFPEELHIGYVTNGIHYPTWASDNWQKLLADTDGKPDFSKAYNTSSEEIWAVRTENKKRLVEYINELMDSFSISRNENPKEILKIKNTLNYKALTIGFARRFATYKRGNLLFKDIERLNKIVNNPDYPVQFIFAGKAHPNDGGGQSIIKEIVEISKRPEFLGKILFLENYDMSLAKELVRGVDVWLNTPIRPLEASGTSGMKALVNGVLNFSVLDGWWVEGYKEGAGWALAKDKTYLNQSLQNEYDSEQIYKILEEQIIPLYYKNNEKGLPEDWINHIKKSVAEIAPEFTTKRMIDDYNSRFYGKISSRYKQIKSDNYKKAKEIAGWKEIIKKDWHKIELVSIDTSAIHNNMLVAGQNYEGKIVININGLNADDVGVEFILSESVAGGELKINNVVEAELQKKENSIAYYSVNFSPVKPGSLNYAFRIYPKNKNLAHRQDCSVVKWL